MFFEGTLALDGRISSNKSTHLDSQSTSNWVAVEFNKHVWNMFMAMCLHAHAPTCKPQKLLGKTKLLYDNRHRCGCTGLATENANFGAKTWLVMKTHMTCNDKQHANLAWLGCPRMACHRNKNFEQNSRRNHETIVKITSNLVHVRDGPAATNFFYNISFFYSKLVSHGPLKDVLFFCRHMCNFFWKRTPSHHYKADTYSVML